MSVDMYDTGTTGKPQFGVYEIDGANAVVDPYNERRMDGGLGGRQILTDVLGWRIRIEGEDLDSVVGLYRGFRSGQIKPTEEWDDMAAIVKEPRAEVQRLEAEVERREAEIERLEADVKQLKYALLDVAKILAV